MGVSGCGKSTIGALLAARLHIDFIDGDSLHPPANVEKMAAGIPLVDADRRPWLAAVGSAFQSSAREGEGLVIACSALKRAYRDAITAKASGACFVHLAGSRSLLESRLTGRSEHFMPAALLDSQLATLEPLQDDEQAISIDIGLPVTEIVETAARFVESRSSGSDR